eukprot:4332359-Amphidinium_carterae.1
MGECSPLYASFALESFANTCLGFFFVYLSVVITSKSKLKTPARFRDGLVGEFCHPPPTENVVRCELVMSVLRCLDNKCHWNDAGGNNWSKATSMVKPMQFQTLNINTYQNAKIYASVECRTPLLFGLAVHFCLADRYVVEDGCGDSARKITVDCASALH